MADTVTTKFGFTKPEIGASNNTWGTKTNGNWDILETKAVRNSIQWSITPGDDNPASGAGNWLLTRYGNDSIAIDSPISVNRQTGTTNLTLGMTYRTAPATPPANTANIFIDSTGNPVLQKPDGSFTYLGVPPGTVAWTAGTAADAGWALCDGQGVSRAANPGLSAKLPVGMYGGDAATIILPDLRGRVVAGVDRTGGRLVTAFNGTVLGAVGGLDYHYLTAAQTPPHTHGYSGSGGTGFMDRANPHSHPVTGGTKVGTTVFGRPQTAVNDSFIPLGTVDIGIGNTDINHAHSFSWSGNTDTGAGVSGGWHPIAQPTICLNAQIKLG
jgi:microcystin-dependent protein